MTSFSILEKRFFHKVEEDPEFFNYYQTLPEVAFEVTHERTMGYLYEAVDYLSSKVNPQVDFTDYDEITETFNFDLTKKEIRLIVSLMFEVYLSRSIAKLKTYEVNWASADLRTFDPSNARTSFQNMYAFVCEKNEQEIDDYKSRDRNTGMLLGIDYTAYSSIDGEN